ncbi:uncharacterized protein LOC128779057 [Panthera pardus]|uniref:Uncharacterized protein LOC128779057 n=1 Tax=Panthera pardus TaxID=9691 RepID=A0A9W2W5L4_PANPR|nr:uncharacterized protein LOC128779057 [Panthera pardus]
MCSSSQVVLTLLVQGPSLGKKELLLDNKSPSSLLLLVIFQKLLLLSGFPLKVKLYPHCIPGVDLQIPPLIPKAAPIPAAPAEPPVAQPIGELENREAQPAPKPSGGKVQGLPDIPVGGPHMSQDSAFLTPPVTLQVEGNPVQFLVDTGAQHSVLIKPHGKISKKSSWVQGATGIKKYPWTTQRTMDLGNGKVTHSFLVIPDSPCPLLGRDLLTKMEAQIHFTPGGPQVTGPHNQPITTLTLRLEDEYRLHQGPPSQSQNIEPWLQQFPGAWAETGGMGLAKHRPALFIELKPGADPVRVRQYPMSMEARNGITPHIRRLLDLGILRPCHSAWNTPLLPVRKPNSADYRPIQDLREANRRVMDIHPTVPNPYTLLSALSPERQWYTVLDLKDAFFSLPLAPKSQELFAFEWSNPERGINGQLTWTRLPQGFKNSPTLFDEALHEDLGEYRNQNPKVTLLQYVDDLLIAAETAEACLQGTKNLLRTLGALGYRASAKKAQICRSEVTYLGYLLREGQRWLTDAQKETVLRIPRPTTRRQTRTWIPPSMTALRYWHRFMEFGKIYRITRCQTPRLPGSLTAAALYIKVKVDRIATWIHYTHARPADPFAVREDFVPEANTAWTVDQSKTHPLKLTLRRKPDPENQLRPKAWVSHTKTVAAALDPQ